MQNLLRLTIAIFFVVTAACSETSNPASPSSSSEHVRVFGASLQASLPAASVDFSSCLQGSEDAACFQLSHPTTAAIVAPGNLTATATGSSVTLSWTAPSGETAMAYIIEAGSASGLANLAHFSTGNTATSYSASGVPPGTYYIRIRAVGAGGASPVSNEAVLVVSAGPCTTPGVPSGLVIVSNSGGTVVFQWNSAAGSPTSYIIEAGSSTGLANLANSNIGPTSTFTAAGVGAGTYYVRIRARNACGIGPASNEVVLVVGGAPGPSPGNSFGPGRYLVTSGIAPGRYYSDPISGCYWERQRGDSGTLADVIANEFIGFDARQWIVDILASDRAFQGDTNCGSWFNTPRHGSQSSISPGMWLVGPQVPAGTYRAEARYGCYWERLRNFKGTIDAIIINGFVNNPGTHYVSIGPLDAGFDADDDCGTWTRLYAVGEVFAPDVSAPLLEIERQRNENRRQEGQHPR